MEEENDELYKILKDLKDHRILSKTTVTPNYQESREARKHLKKAAQYLNQNMAWSSEVEGWAFWSYVYNRLEEMGNYEKINKDYPVLYKKSGNPVAKLVRFLKAFEKF